MLNLENNFQNSEEQESDLENKLEEKTNLTELVEAETEELTELAEINSDNSLDNNPELESINKEETDELNDWRETSEAIVANNEVEKANESWQKAAEERFAIKDFNLETFKRITFNNKAVEDSFAAGKNWEYICNNMNDFVEGYSYETASKSFEVMQSLEDKVPGSVKILHEKFGITNFQRYPEEILLNQLQDGESNKNIGLLTFAVNDWNGAFDNQSNIWSKIYDNQKENLDFKIVECGSNIDLARQLISLKENNDKKVSLAVLSAHSSGESFSLGEENSISTEDIEKYGPKLKDIFSNEAQLVANACSSASVGGWVNSLSKEAGIKAVGPDRPAAIEDVDFVGNEVVPKYHQGDTEAYTNYYKGFLMSK